MDPVAKALDDVIRAIKFEGYTLSQEQLEALRRAVPELALPSREVPEEEQRSKLYKHMWSLMLYDISSQHQEESMFKVERALKNVETLSNDTEANQLLSDKLGSDATEILSQVKKRMEALLERMKSGDTFPSESAVDTINRDIKTLIRSLR